MPNSKEDLKREALSLALTEFRGRLLYHKYLLRLSSIKQESLIDVQKEWENKQRMLNTLRDAIPECAGKSYWWDVPYDAETLPGAFQGCLSLPRGIYSEQDDFAEYTDGIPRRAERQFSVMDVLNSYLKLSDYVVLYADRKRMQANLTASVSVKAILCCEEDFAQSEHAGTYQGTVPLEAVYSGEYQRLQNRVRSISSNLTDRLSAFDRQQDLQESILNALTGRGPFTDRESWFMGETDSDSYYTTALYREYRQNEMKEKARDEISRLNYQMEQMKKQASKAQTDRQQYELQRARAEQQQGFLLKMIRCGYSIYLKKDLIGLVIINRPEKVWQLHHQGDLSPYNIYGNISEAKELGWETPNPEPVMEFVLQEYGTRLKPYSTLASRPKNASDDIWRCWAEKRFAFFVDKSE